MELKGIAFVSLPEPKNGTCMECGVTDIPVMPFGENDTDICCLCGAKNQERTDKKMMAFISNFVVLATDSLLKGDETIH